MTQFLSRFPFFALTCLLSLFMGAAHAQSLDLSTLPEAQRKAVLAQLKSTSKPQEKPLVDHAREWTELGQAVGSGVLAAAEKLGVAANDFASTGLGKITIAVLLWKYLGSQVLSTVFGAVILFAGVSFGWRVVRLASIQKDAYEYVQIPVLGGLFIRKKLLKHERSCYDDELPASKVAQQFAGYLIIAVATLVGGIALL